MYNVKQIANDLGVTEAIVRDWIRAKFLKTQPHAHQREEYQISEEDYKDFLFEYRYTIMQTSKIVALKEVHEEIRLLKRKVEYKIARLR